jgi:hypothetical protein
MEKAGDGVDADFGQSVGDTVENGLAAESRALIDGDPNGNEAEVFAFEWQRIEIILESSAIIGTVISCCLGLFCVIALLIFYFGNSYFLLRDRSTPFDAPRGQNWRSDWDATLERISTPHTLTWHSFQFANQAYKEMVRWLDQLHMVNNEVPGPPIADPDQQIG